jgi:hypothetical protein
MNWLGKLFKKKKKTYSGDQKFIPLIIDEKSALIHEIFGISQERSEELTKNMLTSYKKHDELHFIMIDIISECKHANEIALMMLLFERLISTERQRNTVKQVMSKLFGDDDE